MRRMVKIMQDQFQDLKLYRKIQNIYKPPADRTAPERMARLLDRLDQVARRRDEPEPQS